MHFIKKNYEGGHLMLYFEKTRNTPRKPTLMEKLSTLEPAKAIQFLKNNKNKMSLYSLTKALNELKETTELTSILDETTEITNKDQFQFVLDILSFTLSKPSEKSSKLRQLEASVKKSGKVDRKFYATVFSKFLSTHLFPQIQTENRSLIINDYLATRLAYIHFPVGTDFVIDDDTYTVTDHQKKPTHLTVLTLKGEKTPAGKQGEDEVAKSEDKVDKTIVLFRGTEPLKGSGGTRDVLDKGSKGIKADLDLKGVGFSAAEQSMPFINKYLWSLKEKDHISFLGHSLGGH